MLHNLFPLYAAPPDPADIESLIQNSTNIIVGHVKDVNTKSERMDAAGFSYTTFVVPVEVHRSLSGEIGTGREVSVLLEIMEGQRRDEAMIQKGDYGIVFLTRTNEDRFILSHRSVGVIPLTPGDSEPQDILSTRETIVKLATNEVKSRIDADDVKEVERILRICNGIQLTLPSTVFKELRPLDMKTPLPVLVQLLRNRDTEAERVVSRMLSEFSNKNPNYYEGGVSAYTWPFEYVEIAMQLEVKLTPEISALFLQSSSRDLIMYVLRGYPNQGATTIQDIYNFLLRTDHPLHQEAIKAAVLSRHPPAMRSKFMHEAEDEFDINAVLDFLEMNFQIPDEYKEKRRSLQPDTPPKSEHDHENPLQ